ncbi:MAG: hypothetical protein HC915_01265 [Anaerolineae bacterium]|nr:hypothetical protein [Anaerolineae bacterium]
MSKRIKRAVIALIIALVLVAAPAYGASNAEAGVNSTAPVQSCGGC